MSVAIVILNWNGKKYLQQFLPSVLATDYPNVRCIIADNASTDDSVLFLQQQFPEVEIIRLVRNFGFAKGYNEALKEVDADYYVLLNSDVEVTSGWLTPMIELLEKDKQYAACQPKILAYHKKEIFEYAGAAGGWIDEYGYPFARGRLFDICEKDEKQYDWEEEVFWASGAVLLIRSEVFHEMEGFDEYFFAHQEEIDLCWRMKLAGYKIFCCPRSVAYHVGGGTLPKGNSKKTFLNFRNNHIMLAKNLHPSERWWKIPFRIMLDQASGCKGLLNGEVGYFFSITKAHMAFFFWWLLAKKKKKKVRERRVKELKGVYAGSIVWQHFVRGKQRFSEIMNK